MNKSKCLGIWIDHSKANIIDFSNENSNLSIHPKSIDAEENHSLNRGDKKMHNKEQDILSKYYKNITEVIINYDDVLLFGPTDAKLELFNVLKDDPHFNKINITIKPANKMTEPEQNAFVKEYFTS